MKEGKAAKRVISNLKEVGFVELALFTLSFSFHPNPVVASTRPTPPLSAYHIYSNKRCSPDAIKGNQLSNKSHPLISTATEVWKFNKRRGFYSSKHDKRARFSPLYRKTDFQMIGPVDPFQAYSELPT